MAEPAASSSHAALAPDSSRAGGVKRFSGRWGAAGARKRPKREQQEAVAECVAHCTRSRTARRAAAAASPPPLPPPRTHRVSRTPTHQYSSSERVPSRSSSRRAVLTGVGGTLGACLPRQRRARRREPEPQPDMPQPPPPQPRSNKRGKSSVGSCASSGAAAVATGAVASTSAAPPTSAAADDASGADTKPKASSSSSSAEECGGVGGAVGAVETSAAHAEESSSEEGEVGRLQALLEARGLPPQLLGALGPRMQHLLHRGAGASTAAAARAAQLLAGLQAAGDETRQLQAVVEMSQLLVMGNEDTLAGFPVRQVVPALVELLALEHNFDMMHHACRALTYMLEALPRSSGAVALAVPAFLDKLQAITCMDVAEQSLTALEVLSRRHAKAILQARGVSAVLTYLDFFSINAQRAALAVTANCCQNLSPDEFHLVRESLPLLAGRLAHPDTKSVDSVCLAFSRLVDSFQHDAVRLQDIATPELLANLQQLLVSQPPPVSHATFITVLRLLWLLCAACPPLAITLHRRDIGDTLLCLLTGSPAAAAAAHEPDLLPRSPQELYEITCLMAELLPRLPPDGAFAVDAWLTAPGAPAVPLVTWQWRDERGAWRNYTWAECRLLEAGAASGEDEVCLSALGRSYTVDLAAMQQVNDHTGTARPVQRVAPPTPISAPSSPAPDPRQALVRQDATLVRALLAVLHQVYWSSATPGVRAHALKAILRCVYHLEPAQLRAALRVQTVASHIAGMMAANDVRVVVGSLQLADILMQRLPDEFAPAFRREGVLHQVSQLADPARPLASSPPAPAAVAPSTSSPSSEAPRAASPLQLADMLKRKRAAKRSSAAPTRHARRARDEPAAAGAPGSSGYRRATGTGSKTSSFLSSLNPSRWGRCPHTTSKEVAHHATPALSQHNKEKVRGWVRSTAARLATAWGGAGGGVGALERLAALAQALPDPQRQREALSDLRDTLTAEDVSPFEVNHSGVIGALLAFLTQSDPQRDQRLRLFLHVFAGLPLTPEWSAWRERLPGDSCPALSALVAKVNACVAQLEQLPVRVHDLPARPAVSALKFFNTHQLTCDLRRHPSCTQLRQWKGGVVRIDPLALVQAIERYLAQRGYATPRARDAGGASAHSDDDAASDDDPDDAVGAPSSTHQPGQETDHKLELMMGDSVLPYNMTVYQAVRQFGEQADADADADAPLGHAAIWLHTHTIYYRTPAAAASATAAARPQQTQEPAAAARKGKGVSAKASARRKPDAVWSEGSVPTRPHALAALLAERLPAPDSSAPDLDDAAHPALALLRALHALSRHHCALYPPAEMHLCRPLLPQSDFVNTKLAAKAHRQLQDPLVIMTGNLPSWLRHVALACPFVFPFECRHLLFYVVSFDRDRALQRLLEAGGERGNADAGERVAPRLDRRKRTVTRHNVLRQAEHVMHEFAHSRALLEIQYENEVGTGLGPTLEFYALVSRELQRADLDLWHGSENFKQKPAAFGADVVKSPLAALSLAEPASASEPEPEPGAALVSWPCGLYPAALGRQARPSLVNRVKTKFRLMGKLMAKSVLDSRMVDLPLSVPLYRWLVGEERQLGLGDVRGVAPDLWRSLCRLREVAERARAIAADATIDAEARRRQIDALELDGCPIEELGLDFILPGDACVELRRGGRDTPVTAHNLHQYIELVTHWLLFEGVARQMEAFREGFESVFPIANLRMFHPEELEQVFCGSECGGRDARWDARTLAECIRPDHGYTSDSRAIRMLVDVLASYSRDERRLFLQFATGSPRLPTGGLRALNPPLTVVRKTLDRPDDYLPSVMTCVNYLKLPDYSSEAVLRAKLRQAAEEGQHSFHLS